MLRVLLVLTFAGGGLLRSVAAEYFDESEAVSLFAFDSTSIPYTQNLRLQMRSPLRHEGNPVLGRGAPGSPDAFGVQFYGSVIREGDRYRLWYVAFDNETTNKITSSRWRAAYAESEDGLRWTKPDLGLVEFAGNRHNNLVSMDGEAWGFVNLKVIRDELDPDAGRRYKMTTHVYFRHNTRLGTLLPFVSADGFSWKPVKDVKPEDAELRKDDLFLPGVHFEPCGGLYQWDGLFYITGQNAMPGIQHYQGRVVRVYRSADFVNWSGTNHLGFVRDTQHTWLGEGRSREGEQNHEGISVWNRGNVLLGITGQWHGAVEWKDVTVDLGFVLSNDGLNFREPEHERTFLKRGEEGQWDEGGLLQGQGFENIGEKTFIYYGAWDPRHTGGAPEPRGGVGLAVLPRDRFGDLVVDESGRGSGDYQVPEITSELISNSITVKKGTSPGLFLNADGLGADAALRVQILDHAEIAIPAYSGENAAVVRESGFQTPVLWNGEKGLRDLPSRIKFHLTFEGSRNNAIRFSALYLKP